MMLEAFLNKFDQLCDAPDGVNKMRELVLRLAFLNGFSTDHPADDGAPRKWEKRTIESIASSIVPGFACSRSHQVEGGHVHLRTHNISTLGTLNFDLLVRIVPKMVDPQRASIRSGDILFNNTNSQELVGETCLVDRDYEYGFSNHITRIRLKDEIFPGFVAFYLTLLRNSGHFARLCTRWINQAAINTDTLKEQIIYLPSLREQRRIVAKVDELMVLCGLLEAQQQERDLRRTALVRASLYRFAEAPTPDNLLLLFHPSYSVTPADLRKSILTLAVQGKLVAQDPNDAPAIVLNSKLPEQLQTIADRVGARYSLPTTLIEASDDLPRGWGVAQIQSIGITQTGTTPSKSESNFTGHDVPFIKPGDIQGNDVDYDNEGLSADGLSAGRLIPKSSILMVSIGGSIGKTAIVDRDVSCNQQINSVSPAECIAPRFVLAAIRSAAFQSEVMNRAAQGTLPIISKGKWETIRIPVPPAEEQRRIVASAEALMALVDQLEIQLAAAQKAAKSLFEAFVVQLTIEA
jgi:type I restriction enzyme S subunit